MRIFLRFFLLLLPLQIVTAQNHVEAKINLFQKDIYAKIDAVVQNNNHIYKHELNYTLLSLKKNKGEKSFKKDQRFGNFSLLPNEKKTIATFKINISPDELLKVYLFIRDGEQLIASDSVTINETLDILKTDRIEEDDIEIKGLVVENVKTKIGKDFYDIFYQKYNRSGNKYSFVININEKPFLGGRGALISVEIGDDKILEFQARPNDEMLEKAADYALVKIEAYNKNRKNMFEKEY